MKKGLLTVLTASAVVFSSMNAVFASTPVNNSTNQNITSSNARLVIEGKLLSPERNLVALNNRLLVPARSTFKELGASVDWYENSGIVRVKKGNTSLLMKVGETEAYINGVEKDLDAPPVLVGGTVMVPLRYTAEAFQEPVKWDGSTETAFIGNVPTDSTGSTTSRGGEDFRGRVVVIDAGHGGSESGAVSEGLEEKDLNLDIAKRLNVLLTAVGIKTYMTRTDDSYVDLYARSGLANSVNADLFVSIHNNAMDDTSITGSMTLYYPSDARTKNGVSPVALATIVQKELTGSLSTKDLGIVPRPNLAVLRTTNMPAIIAEVGYITNHNELTRLESGDFRQNAAKALCSGIEKALTAMG